MKLALLVLSGLIIPLTILLAVPAVWAHCPLCTAATGAVVATTRVYGVDDLIVGTLIGGFAISTALWIDRILKKRNRGKAYVRGQGAAIVGISIALTVAGFLFMPVPGTATTMFGFDKLIVGILAGSAVSLFAFALHEKLRKINGKSFFPLQAVAIVLLALFAVNTGFYVAGVI